MQLSDFCYKNQIELIALYPNATHVMQPMNVALFHPLKVSYRDAVREWRFQNDGQQLTKVYFAKVLKNALESLDTKRILQNGFRRCRLYPFSENAINYVKLIQRKESNTATNLSENVTKEISPSTADKSYLSVIESYINASVLEQFKSNLESTWIGSVEYQELFNFWRQFKNSITHTVINQSTVPEEAVTSISNAVSNDKELMNAIVLDNSTTTSPRINKNNQHLVNNTFICDTFLDDSRFADESNLSKDKNILCDNGSSYELVDEFILEENGSLILLKSVVRGEKHSTINLDVSSVVLDEKTTCKVLKAPTESCEREAQILLKSNNLNHSDHENTEVNISTCPGIMPDSDTSSNAAKYEMKINKALHNHTSAANQLPLDLCTAIRSYTVNNNCIDVEKRNKQFHDTTHKDIFKSGKTISSEGSTEDINIQSVLNLPTKTSKGDSRVLKAIKNSNKRKSECNSLAFKDYLFYPKVTSKNKKKRKPKERLPFVATSEEWRAWHASKQKEKEESEQKKLELKNQRELKIKMKQELQVQLTKIKIEKDRIQA
ncbi:uncharacterized protein [Prorops nasuta]|uniref:uncharacterized protein n=1 Tax=Prorops nasuta TaxID=863751 RepID=UPI0034D00B27